MSEFTCPIVRIASKEKHPNADTLSTTEVEGCPVSFKSNSFEVGDLAVYIPVDAVVPLDRPEFEFLKAGSKEGATHARIKARRLCKVFSMGFLVPFIAPEARDANGAPLAAEDWLGQDYAAALGVTKYEEPEDTSPTFKTGGRTAKDPGHIPVYNLEPWRKYRHLLVLGEEVVATEKLHGCNLRAEVDENGVFHIGSHKVMKRADDENVWAKVAAQYSLAEKLSRYPGLAFYGEVYGQVQDLKYGAQAGELMLAFFDIYNAAEKRWLDYDEAGAILKDLDLPRVPELGRGPYDPETIEGLSKGFSTIAKHIREGVVVRPVKERSARGLNRVVLKLVGEQYLLRNGGTEHH